MIETYQRILMLGDITGINPGDIRTFMETAACQFGGAYPSCEAEMHRLLAIAGIPPDSTITLCRSIEERAEQILNACNHRGNGAGTRFFYILDQEPFDLVRAISNVTKQKPVTSEVLQSITVINIRNIGMPPIDRMDPSTGIRIVTLPQPPYRFPMHPTPDS